MTSRLVGTSARTLARTMGSGVLRALVVPATSFLVLPLVLDDLGRPAYGVWATLSSLLAVGGLVDAGVRTEIVRRVAVAHGAGDLEGGLRAARQGVTILAAVCACLAAAVVVGRGGIVDFAFPHLPAGLRSDTVTTLTGMAVLLAVTVVNGGMFSVAAGLQRTDYENVTTVAAAITGAAVTVLSVAVLDQGLLGMLYGATANVLTMVAGQLWATRHLAPRLRWPFSRIGARAAAGFFAVSTLLFLSQVGDVVDFQLDKVLLSRYVASQSAGEYQIGTMLSLNLRLLALLPLAVLLTGTAEMWSRTPERSERLLRATTAFVYGVGGLLMTGVVVFAPGFLHLWLGSGLDDAARAAQLLAIAMCLNLAGAPWTSYAIGRGWVGVPALAAAANMVTNAVVSFVLVRRIGFDGALYGSLAGNAVGLTACYLGLRRHRADGWLVPALRPAAVCLVAGVAAATAVDRVPSAVSSWPALVASGLVFSALVGAALVAVSPRDLRADVTTTLRGLRTAR